MVSLMPQLGIYLGAEVLQRESLGNVDIKLGVGLYSCEASGNCEKNGQSDVCSHSGSVAGVIHVLKNCLAPPDSSMTSTRPGFSCSIDGTWFAKTPISPDSAGMFTWVLSRDSGQYDHVGRLRRSDLSCVYVHVLGLVEGLPELIN